VTSTRSLLLLFALVTLSPSACTSPDSRPAAVPLEQGQIDVYLLPVGSFPFEAANALAVDLSSDVGVNVRASLPMGADDLRPLPSGDQFAAEDVIARARAVGSRLPDRSARSIVIALAILDINDREQRLRFIFGKNDLEGRTSVLSTARMGYSTTTVEGTAEQVYLRLYKMTKRAIGEQYFGYRRSSDIRDVMYAPIMSLADIDAMGTSFAERSPPEGAASVPSPPQGYAWRHIPSIRAAILVPDGWHFREEHQGTTRAAFVTREDIGSGRFVVGVSLNAFVGDPSAPARLKRILDEVAARCTAQQLQGANGPFVTSSCQFSSPRPDGLEPVRVYMLGIVNARTRTSYLLTFESPQSEWPATWTLGRTILDSLALETEI